MKRILWLMCVAALASGCTQTPAETQVINDAAEALGGRTQIEAVNTLVLEGTTGTNANLGQNRAPDADLPIFNVTEFKRSVDVANGRVRQQVTRVPTAPGANPQPQQQNFGLDADVAFNVAADGMVARQPEQVATDRRIDLILHHPVAIVRAALDPTAKVANPRTVGNMNVVDITTAKGESVTLAVDSTTHLPVTATTMSYNANLGDVARETAFADYQDVGGLKLPTRLTSKIDKYANADYRIAKNTVNAPAADLAAPAEVKAAPVPGTTAMVTVEEIAKGIWLLAGQTHNSVLVEFSDHTELIEVPQNDTRSLAVIAKAREIKPDKPLTKVVVTHHHFDHSGGIRAAISEGLTLVTHEMNKPLFEELAQRTHSIVQDALAKNPKPLQIETVGEEATIKDAMRTMQLYHVPTPHADSMLVVYFPAERVLVQGDLFNPANPNRVFAASFLENIEKRKLRVDRHVPIHGTIQPHGALVKLVRTPPAPTTN